MSDNGNVMMATAPVIEGQSAIGQTRAPAPETVLRVALDVLTARAARWLALLMSFTLFGAAVWWPDRWRLAAAAGFTVLMAIPVWFRKEQ